MQLHLHKLIKKGGMINSPFLFEIQSFCPYRMHKTFTSIYSRLRLSALILSSVTMTTQVHATDYVESNAVPVELRSFIANKSRLLAYAEADLNGDGKADYVFIVEKPGSGPDAEEQRTLHIAIRQADGKLKIVKTNKQMIRCSRCGGPAGDPFNELSAVSKSFSVSHYGGANERWSQDVQFNYSRKDDTWQLVKVEESTFDVTTPDRVKTRTYKPPRHFGKIDISDFDQENFLNVGKK